MFEFLWFAGGALVCAIGSYVLFLHMAKRETLSRTKEIEKLREADEKRIAERKKELENAMKSDREKINSERQELSSQKKKIDELEGKIVEKEERIEKRLSELDGKFEELYKKETDLADKRKALDEESAELSSRLSEIAKLSEEEAKDELFSQVEARYESDLSALAQKKRTEYRKREKEIAQEVLIGAIQQYAAEVTSEALQTMISLESDDLKGKLIGKEGRNITAFERSTGVSLVIDDTPDTVFLSSFDLFRRYIAKKTLEDLIADKRIQPARIEEIAEKNQREAEKLIADLGEKTLAEMGITDIPNEIVPLIGKFRFRTSYGQNILTHSKEVAYLSEAIAKLIGADPALALKG